MLDTIVKEEYKGVYMNLVRDKWTKEGIEEFQAYLKTLGNPDKEEWLKRVLQTSRPAVVINNPTMKKVANEICQGNYLEFLDLLTWDNYESSAIYGYLFSKIEDFDLWKKHLDFYSERIDSWANCDLLDAPYEGNEDRLLALSREYCKSDLTFRRRIGLLMHFYYLDSNIEAVFETLDTFTHDDEYYIIMMGGWLLSVCMRRQREKTLAYLPKSKAYYKIINKGIQKCRESTRISKEDKEFLLRYKK